MMHKIYLYFLVLFLPFNLQSNWFQSLHEKGAYAFYIKANDSSCKGNHLECNWSNNIFVLMKNSKGSSLCDFDSANFNQTSFIREKVKQVYGDSTSYDDFIKNLDGFQTRRGIDKPSPLEVKEFLIISIDRTSKNVTPLKCILNIYTWNGKLRNSINSPRLAHIVDQPSKRNLPQRFFYQGGGGFIKASGEQSEVVSFNFKSSKDQEIKDKLEKFIREQKSSNSIIDINNFNDVLDKAIKSFSDIPQLRTKQARKDPFETNAEYLERTSGLEKNNNKRLYFLKEKDLSPNYYDAETSNWNIPVYDLHASNVDVTYYDGQNAFGASKQITKRVGTTQSIRIENKSMFANPIISFLEIQIPMERSYAKENYKDLKVFTLYSFDGNPDRLVRRSEREFPSFDYPYDVNIENLEISMKLEAIAIKNTRFESFYEIFIYDPPSLNIINTDSVYSVVGARTSNASSVKELVNIKSNAAPQLNILGSIKKERFLPTNLKGKEVGVCDWASLDQGLFFGPWIFSEGPVVFETDKGDNNVSCNQTLFIDGTFITSETDDSVYLVGRF